jgi:hypothetical protein
MRHHHTHLPNSALPPTPSVSCKAKTLTQNISKLADLEDKIKSVDEEIIQVRKHTRKDLDSVRLRAAQLTIVVSATASGDGEAELSVFDTILGLRLAYHMVESDLAIVASHTVHQDTSFSSPRR